MELTVAEVSGLIAAGVFVLQLLIPLLVPWILVAFLDDEHSVTTWNFLGRFLHSGLWPGILGTSTAVARGVRKRVYLTSWALTLLLFCISVASICSPLGLFNSIEPASEATPQPFGYLKDTTAFGHGTPPRSGGPFSRYCGNGPCPGATANETCQHKGLADVCTLIFESRIPADLLDLYNDGPAVFSPTVSSIFDMQYRSYRNGSDQYTYLGWYVVPDYRTISILLLGDEYQVVEGLVVDLKSGGIGFRNHTAPKEPLKYGSTWTEDILFVEPETQCVPMNISIDSILPPNRDTSTFYKNVSITDKGGFSELGVSSIDFRPYGLINGQEQFDLRDRAHKAAVANNFLTMAYLNLTDPDPSNISRLDSVKGQNFPLPDRYLFNTTVIGYRNIKSTINFGDYLNFHDSDSVAFNPHRITPSDFAQVVTTCGGSTGVSRSNLNSTLIACGMVYAPPQRTDGGSDNVLDPLSTWSSPLYSCASAVKATIKTVEFKFNGTGINGLRIQSVRPKAYANSSSLPIWGVEDLGLVQLPDSPPMWGVVGSQNSSLSHASTIEKYNISTVAKESLYLAGYLDDSYSVSHGSGGVSVVRAQNLPGVDFYNQGMFLAYTIQPPGSQSYGDYSGKTSYALFSRWRELSQSAEGIASIVNQVWTDASANAVLGTKGWGLSDISSNMAIPSKQSKRSDDPSPATVNVPVIVYHNHIRYHMPFAIPAFVTLGATTILIVGLLILLIMRRTGIAKLRDFLESTSVGRILWPFIQPIRTPGESEVPANQWIKIIGHEKVRITQDSITLGEEVLENRRLLSDLDYTVEGSDTSRRKPQ